MFVFGNEWKNISSFGLTEYMFIPWVVGTWPIHTKVIFSWIRLIIIILLEILFILIIFNEFYNNCLNVRDNGMEVIMLFECSILTILKLMSLKFHKKKLYNCCVSMIKDYVMVTNEDELNIMRQICFKGKIVCLTPCYLAIFCSLLYAVDPVLEYDYNENINYNNISDNLNLSNLFNWETWIALPIPLNCGLRNRNVSITVYIFIYFHQSITLILNSTGNTGTDSFLLGLSMHLCGQVEILKKRLKYLSDEESEDNSNKLDKLINRHLELLHIAELLIDIISNIILVQLIASSILICILGFQVIVALKLGDNQLMGRAFFALITVLLQLFSYGFVGEYLQRQMEGVGYALYESIWYNQPVRYMRNIIFIMMKSQYPVQLVARGFVVINMETYMAIVKTSVSYLSMLRVMIKI